MENKKWTMPATPFLFFLAALAINLLLIKSHPCIEEDGVGYANAFFKGLGYSGLYPPGYPLLIGLSSMIFKDVELSARLVSVLLGSLMMFPLFFMAQWAFGRKAAVICCCLALIYPNLAEYTPAALSESTFLFFFLLGLLVTGAALYNEKQCLYLLSGVIWGLAFLTRPEGIGYVFLGIMVLAYRFLRDRAKRNLAYMAIFVTGFLVVTFPYLLDLKKETGHWSLGNKANMNLVLGEGVGGQEEWGNAFEKCYFSLAEGGKKLAYEVMLENRKGGTLSYVMSHKKELARRYIVNLHLMNKYVIPGFLYPALLILFSAGLFLGNVAETKRAAILFISFLPYLAFPLFIVAPRYFVCFIPIILIWSARGVIEIARFVSGSCKDVSTAPLQFLKRQGIIEAVIVAVVVLSFVPFTFRSFIRGENHASIYKDIGLWMRSNVPAGSKIMSRKPWVPFYAGMEQVGLPFEPWDKILGFAKYKGVDYLVADQKIIGNRESLGFLFDDAIASDDVKKIREFKDSDGSRINIYKIVR